MSQIVTEYNSNRTFNLPRKYFIIWDIQFNILGLNLNPFLRCNIDEARKKTSSKAGDIS